MATRTRYTISQLCDKFIVIDSQSSLLKVMNSQGQMADNSDPAQARYFGMTLGEAQELSAKLEATR